VENRRTGERSPVSLRECGERLGGSLVDANRDRRTSISPAGDRSSAASLGVTCLWLTIHFDILSNVARKGVN
jgi:hypothetical protein